MRHGVGGASRVSVNLLYAAVNHSRFIYVDQLSVLRRTVYSPPHTRTVMLKWSSSTNCMKIRRSDTGYLQPGADGTVYTHTRNIQHSGDVECKCPYVRARVMNTHLGFSAAGGGGSCFSCSIIRKLFTFSSISSTEYLTKRNRRSASATPSNLQLLKSSSLHGVFLFK